MRILITGGAGFIGSHIVDACLAAGHEPFVVDDLSSGARDNLPSGVTLFVADIRDADKIAAIFDEVRPEAVSHQAAQLSVSRSVHDPVFDAQVNVVGLLNVCTHAVRVGVKRFVFASSGGVLYGDVYTPATEDAPANPISPYGISKWAGEQYLQFFAREHGISATALRYANVYGPRQNPHGEAGVVAIFCQRLLRGDGITINGDGKYDRDYVYGPDVAQANLAALTSDRAGFRAFNLGTGVATDVNRLAQMIRDHVQAVRHRRDLGSDLPQPQHGPARAGDLRSSLVSAARAKQELGWQPQVTLAEGLCRTVEWFAERVPC